VRGHPSPRPDGFLLDDATPERIAAALRELIGDPGLRRRLGESAAAHTRERFDPALNARAVESVYDSLLGVREAVDQGATELACEPAQL
jgi:glycosyltransferase involved in cell wall biosynthesis